MISEKITAPEPESEPAAQDGAKTPPDAEKPEGAPDAGAKAPDEPPAEDGNRTESVPPENSENK
jgi:hypothetical protein